MDCAAISASMRAFPFLFDLSNLSNSNKES
jgi:hypothetical protein